MSAQADDPPTEAGKVPTGRLARTARVGGLVTGQGLRWAGMRTANRIRTPERAAAAQSERTAALVGQLVDQLGQMRGAAMKVGQMISMVEFDGLAQDEQDELQRKLATLRDDVPPVRFADLEKLMRREFGGPLQRVFSDFDEHAFAAASIGQVHRATTVNGDDVVVKVQYPGVAEAVETDLRNARLLLPLVKRLAPGLDADALAAELRERIAEELDYELEAQNHRRIERLMRRHPFLCVPRVRTDLSTRRVLVSEYIEGERFEAVRRGGEAQRDRYGEIVFRFFFGLLYRDRIALGDPHPGNYLLRPDGRVCFLDFGLLRDVDAARVAAERAIALAVRDRDPAALKAALGAGGYLPASRAGGVDADSALRLMRMAIKWYAIPGERRFSPEARRGRDRERPDTKQRAAIKMQINQFTLPPETILIRRMHGIVAVVLEQLRAGADWGAIAAEYLHGAPPATPLGQAEADFFARRGRTAGVGRGDRAA
jgi:predicted unusual protein kinase regulating ubiquinone biosynthesis (AarF/ABC1/UbiB family)